jgi:hypothetical protein
MNTTQITTVTPKELVDLISESVKAQLLNFSTQFNGKENEETKEFLTSKETQRLLKISSVTVNTWQKNGTLKVYKLGNRSFFKYSEILETLYNSNRSQS